MSDQRTYRVGEQKLSSREEAARLGRLWGLHVRVLNSHGGPVISPLPPMMRNVREEW